MILDEIISHKRKEIEELKTRFPEKRLREALEKNEAKRKPRSFARAIGSGKGTSIIAEIKKASPSCGVIREDFDPPSIARLYEAGGAKALSILTESRYFMGHPRYLKTVRKVSKLPILRKDFIIDSYQIYESAGLASDAILLIASLLETGELEKFQKLASGFNMDSLIEVHTEEDLLKAIDAGAEMIGINNRNLMNLETNIHTAEHLLPKVPRGKIVVVESGIQKRQEIEYYKSLGVHAFLIGTSLMKSKDILAQLKGLQGEDE